ncbi:MAG: 50S ribosomal protein L18 [Candidatus Pacebacteria bacterium]|nr:50S ribosomal protein L18 [Candidatus Paceibacterota bacterium]
MLNDKIKKRIRRHKRIRSKISGNNNKPRVSVFKSNIYLFVQAIDDEKAKTIFSARTDFKIGNKIKQASDLGEKFAKELIKKGIKVGVFDRGGNLYTGRVKAFADGLRKGGLKI